MDDLLFIIYAIPHSPNKVYGKLEVLRIDCEKVLSTDLEKEFKRIFKLSFSILFENYFSIHHHVCTFQSPYIENRDFISCELHSYVVAQSE